MGSSLVNSSSKLLMSSRERCRERVKIKYQRHFSSSYMMDHEEQNFM